MASDNSGPDVLTSFVRDLLQQREQAAQQDWTYQEPPTAPDPWPNTRLQWKPSQRRPQGPAITIEELRERMPCVMKGYIERPTDDMLLMKVAAGGGKTHAGVAVAQWAAERGHRVLWAAGRHNLYHDLWRLPHFDRELWHHWLPIHEQKDEGDTIPTTCRYARAQHQWARKGYDSMDLCLQLCTMDGHIQKCPYRRQQHRREPIIFAMHNHLASGMSISDFSLVIVDELPLNAFVDHRVIPPDGIRLPGASGPIEQLLEVVHLMANQENGELYAGPKLFKQIGPILQDVYAQIEMMEDMLPQIPRVASADDVAEKPYWYLFDFLTLASPEYDAWRHGWPRWAERVKVTGRGLHLLQRAEPWDQLPLRMVVLDATASASMYRQIFDRPVQEFHPRIQRQGSIYQVTGRLNGTTTLLEDETPTRQARELLEISRRIAGGYDGRVGVVCNKALRPLFEREFGESNVEHFYALRGTNSLEDVNCLLVVGNPAPDLMSTINTAAALNEERIRPYGQENEHGYIQPLFYAQEREYAITDELRQKHDGQTPWRNVKGFWSEPELQAIYEAHRENELLQAIHRARPNVRECDVWVLTSTPTSEPLDGVWDDPPIGPDGIYWKTWLQLEPWLQEQFDSHKAVSTTDLATAADVDPTWVRRKGWIEAIARHMPDKWELTLIPTGGRPSKGIAPL